MPKVEEDGNNNERLQLGHKSDVIVEEGEREGTMIFCPWVSDRWKLDNMMREERGGRTSTTKTEMAAAVTQFLSCPSCLPSLSYLSFHHIINSICYTTVAGLGREGEDGRRLNRLKGRKAALWVI